MRDAGEAVDDGRDDAGHGGGGDVGWRRTEAWREIEKRKENKKGSLQPNRRSTTSSAPHRGDLGYEKKSNESTRRQMFSDCKQRGEKKEKENTTWGTSQRASAHHMHARAK